MWRNKKLCCGVYIDVCLRVPQVPSTANVKRRNYSIASQQEVLHGQWRIIFEQYAKQNNLSQKDWYQLSSSALDEKLQQFVSKKFRGSMYRALSTIFPEIEWKPWEFKHHRVPKNYWKEQSNQRKFFDDLGHILGIQTLDDWYEKLAYKDVVHHGGATVLAKYDHSPSTALMAAYPEHNWIPWKFSAVPTGYWKELSNQRKFFDELGRMLGIQTLDDWYEKLSHKEITKYGGAILAQYDNSPAAALMAVYPEHKWIPWKFSVVSAGFWNSKDNVRKFLNELSEKLSIQTLDDWYRVDWKLLKQLGATSLISKYGGLYNFLKEQYPHHPWNADHFKQAKKSQRWLAVNLKKIFPDEEILEDYLHPKAVFPTSNRPIQLDIFIPSRSLAFEYQGEQHYQDFGIFYPTKICKQRDEEKRAVCAANNIKLIEIPYWWNKTKEELQDMISKSGLVSSSNQKSEELVV